MDSTEWCLIESDPAVFTELLESLGVSGVELQELWSLDDEALLQLQNSGSGSSSIYGLIFLFQWNAPDEQRARHNLGILQRTSNESSSQQQQLQSEPQPQPPQSSLPLTEAEIPPGMFFAQQVTTNACATQALLSVILNHHYQQQQQSSSESTTTTTNHLHRDPLLQLGPILTEFQSFTSDFPPHLRGLAIAGSEELVRAHNRFARPHDPFLLNEDELANSNKKKKKKKRDDELGEAFHFVAYIPFGAHVYELDGLQSGPIQVGTIPEVQENADSLSSSLSLSWLTVARQAIQTRMNHNNSSSKNHVKYNLMAVIQDKRIPLQQQLDTLLLTPSSTSANEEDEDVQHLRTQLDHEHAKREQWKRENERRRHNYAPLILQVLKELARRQTLKHFTRIAQEKANRTHTTAAAAAAAATARRQRPPQYQY